LLDVGKVLNCNIVSKWMKIYAPFFVVFVVDTF
jgi:hypothetical protein